MDLDVGTWPSAAVATVLAAVVATAFGLTVSVVSGVWSLLSWRRDHGLQRAVFRWQRVTWALEMVASGDVGKEEIGMAAATSMREIRRSRGNEWGVMDDLLMVVVKEGT